MSQYFENRTSDGSFVVVDDTYKNMQVVGEVYGKNASYRYVNDEHCYFIDTGQIKAKDSIWGLDLDELDGLSFNFDYVPFDDHTLRIQFYENTPTGTTSRGYYWTQTRNDIINRLKFYAFTERQNFHKTEHLSGVEIYQADGTVLYSSAWRTLNVLACDVPELGPAKHTPVNFIPYSVQWTRRGIYIAIGRWCSVDHNLGGISVVLKLTISGKKVSFKMNPNVFIPAYLNPGNSNNYCYSCFGALVGEI